MEEFVHEDCMVSSTDLQYQNQNHNQNTPALRRVFPPSTTDSNSRAAARATRARDGGSRACTPRVGDPRAAAHAFHVSEIPRGSARLRARVPRVTT